jgi:pyruvate formate lyase activating enzyme
MPSERPIPSAYQLVPTRLQVQLDNGQTQCNLCPWYCKLSHGQRGFCQAHVNRHGTLYNLSYGIVSSLAIDTIESKPVRHYRPGSTVMSVGSYGCNFRCAGCHNAEISWGESALDLLAKGESTAAYVEPKELVAAAKRLGVDGIAFTYSEPAVWLEYVYDVAKEAHQQGLYTLYVSNSFVTAEALAEIAPYLDVLCSDVKSLDQQFYEKLCPVATPNQVLESIEAAHRLGIHVETRTNVIPTANDAMEELAAIATWIRDHLGKQSPWHITRFFPAHKLDHLPATEPELLERARVQSLELGLEHVYTYTDKGCDCAADNRPVAELLDRPELLVHEVKKCAADCCDDSGTLLKRYENQAATASEG